MRWTVETLDPVDAEIAALPPGLQAPVVRLLEMIENVGLERLREPHVKHLDGALWELRAKAPEGIARGIYVVITDRRVIVLHVFVKKSQAPAAITGTGTVSNETGGRMTKLAEVKRKLMADPQFAAEYEKADAEFAVIEALVNARSRANLTQLELARRLGTTQSAIARLEGGRVSPSLSTLRRYAEATGAKLRIELVTR